MEQICIRYPNTVGKAWKSMTKKKKKPLRKYCIETHEQSQGLIQKSARTDSKRLVTVCWTHVHRQNTYSRPQKITANSEMPPQDKVALNRSMGMINYHRSKLSLPLPQLQHKAVVWSYRGPPAHVSFNIACKITLTLTCNISQYCLGSCLSL